MIPTWAVTLVWFLAGVFATGAFWYFLGQKNKLGTLWTGFLTVAFALLAIALQIHNDLLSRTRDAQTAVDVPPKTEPPMKQEHVSDKRDKDPIEKEVSGTSEQKPKASVSQTMVNSPGSVQVAGNLTLAADRRLIQTLALEIRVKQQTDPKPPAQPETSMGLGSSVAFFTKGGTRIRFTTPVYQIVDQQLDADTRQLTLASGRCSGSIRPGTTEGVSIAPRACWRPGARHIPFFLSAKLLSVPHSPLAGNPLVDAIELRGGHYVFVASRQVRGTPLLEVLDSVGNRRMSRESL